VVAVDGSPLTPSSVYLTDAGTLAVGRDADRQARIDPSRYEPNPKRRIDDGAVLLGSSAIPVVEVIAAVLRRVASEVRRQFGSVPDDVRLTHPARWGRVRRNLLIDAARRAGLCESGAAGQPMLIAEPVAAATGYAALTGQSLGEGAGVAVYDLGGGTLDVAVLRRTAATWTVVAEAGLNDLGGVDFDQALIDYLAARQSAEHREVWDRMLSATDAQTRRLRRIFENDVRDCKEALSRFAQAEVPLGPPLHDQLVTRAEFEDLIRPQLTRGVDLLADQLATSGVPANRLSGVYLVGGSSRIPLVARLIQERLNITPTTLDQPETSVVMGAILVPPDGATDPTVTRPVRAQPTPAASSTGGPNASPLGPQTTPHSRPPTTPRASPPTTPHSRPPAGPPTAPLVGPPTAATGPTRAASVPGPPTPAAPTPAAGARTTGPVPSSPHGGSRTPTRRLGPEVGSTSGRSSPPPPKRRWLWPAVIAAVAVVAIAVAIALVNRGGGHPSAQAPTDTTPVPTPAPTAAATTVATTEPTETTNATTDASSASASASADFDSYFTDPNLRAYMRPRYSLLRSCELSGDAPEQEVICQLNDGLQIILGADTSLGEYVSRRDGAVVGTAPAAQNSWKETRWSAGGAQGRLRTWLRDGDTPILYFDRDNALFGMLGVGSGQVTQTTAETLMKVWNEHFKG
jgi:hypothetical protein